MPGRKRRLIINWSEMHDDLKRLIENELPRRKQRGIKDHNGENPSPQGAGYSPGRNKEPYDREPCNNKGWSYLTFYPKGTQAQQILFNIDRIEELAKNRNYYLPREVVVQHNKVVVTAYPEGDSPVSPLVGLYHLLSFYVKLFSDVQQYPSHGFYGKFGGIYERPEKGRVLAIYSGNDDLLLTIYESIEQLIPKVLLKGIRFGLHFSNGLSAIPRMLYGFDDPEYRRSGVEHYKIADPTQFVILLSQVRHDHQRYYFDPVDVCSMVR